MFSDYYYNETLKKTIAVFGTLFNNISVGRKNGNVISNFQKVPIVHGPRQKFLDRIREKPTDADDDSIALKLPRMSFEVTSVSYDSTVKLNKFNSTQYGTRTDGKVSLVREGVPYTVNLQLTVMSRNYDDGLQIVEQILPSFSPLYTVTVKDFEGPGSRTDLPFVLTGVSPDTQYDGDLENTRTVYMWVLDFSVKVKFVTAVKEQKVIESIDAVNLYDRLQEESDSLPISKIVIKPSLAYRISQDVDSRLRARNPSTSLNIFSVQNHTQAIYTRNSSLWCSDWDLTCFSPWNSAGGQQFAGTLISPRHVIFAAHFCPGVGTTMRFVKSDGTVVSRTITAVLTHPDYVPYYPDISVALLNSDVEAGISFARVLPDNWAQKIPDLSSAKTIPSLTLDQEEKALVTDWYSENNVSSFVAPSDPVRLSFYEPKIGGDSGNPAFIRINGKLVILTVWTYGGAGQGTSIRGQKAAINNMMTQLGGDYQLTEIDLSEFTSYT